MLLKCNLNISTKMTLSGTLTTSEVLAFTIAPNIQSTLKPAAASSITIVSNPVVSIVFGVAGLVATLSTPFLVHWREMCKRM
ncbi:hypothetical protein ACMFMF_007021 [Clarireedia jacksonii]